MDGLVEYSIPVKGLHNGIHEFDFRIDHGFFQHFENSPIVEGDIELRLTFDKHSDMYVLEFDFEGKVRTECDRCLAPIDLPVSDHQRLLVKFSEEDEIEDADVVYISPETQQLDVSKYVYEYIILSMPLIRTYDCENDEPRPCNEDMLRYLENGRAGATPDDGPINPIWEELKKSLNKN